MVKSEKPALLYLSPVIPALTGNGLAMRAGTVLECLAQRYDVHLLVAPLYAPFTSHMPEALQKMCRRATFVSTRPQPRGWLATVDVWRETQFDVVHVFRLSMVTFSDPYLGPRSRRPRRHLDLDDIESVTRRRLAALYDQNGDSVRAAHEESEAARHEILENDAFGRFDRVYVCSALDQQKLEGRTRGSLHVLPNAVRLPAEVPERTAEGIFTFFFVGTLGYYPNEDAVRYLCAEIVPRIRALAGDGFRVNIAGTGASQSLRRDVNMAQVRFLGEVADLHTWYAEADAVVGPVRAGGGTRIKILEAFSYSRPVVATSIAMEGIEARAGEHVLVGDTASDFAQQCARLVTDRELGSRLARNAFTLLLKSYTLQSLANALDQMDQQDRG
jgi:glycosyltransferase involved in cell wall biosynthesis